MSTKETFKDGKCGSAFCIRVKTYKSGFSITCLKRQSTIAIVGTPFIQRALDADLQSFCWGCPLNANRSTSEVEKK